MFSLLEDHFFTVQDNSLYHGKESGAIRRTNFPVIKANIPCNIQEVSKYEAVLKYDIKVSEKLYVIYHRFTEILFNEAHRFLINIDPFFGVFLPGTALQNIMILEFKGRKRPTLSRNSELMDCFELYCEHNRRWIL